jgi:hypothetical protein
VTPATEAALAVLDVVFLGRFAGPPDQPEGAEDGDLQDYEEEEDRPEAIHGGSV